MNKTALKNYAVKARRDFISAIKNRAYLFGLSETERPTVETSGEVAIIKGKAYPRKVAGQIDKLVKAVEKQGFEQIVNEVSYTWFNRLIALRYMELHGFLPHGFRVLSSADGSQTPEILSRASEVEFPTLKREKIVELKLKNQDAELYRILLTAQCNALSASLPFLFERIDDETELLLPDNLLFSDSIIRKLVDEIDEADWQEVEIIGWLYQFYISEKKDEVIGKTVKSEDIPAATQLFTPNWIVKYMTQNSLGRLWLENNPHSQIAEKMEFYIKPSEENQSEIPNPQSQINPESLRILDPACGSGHILVEAYELLKEIYLERGYRLRDIPQIILEKNLFGIDIDKRAAQLASFALLMKARGDDRRIFEKIRDKGQGARDEGQGEKNLIPHPSSLIPCILTVPDSSQLEFSPEAVAELFFSRSANRGAVPIRESSFLFGEMELQPSLMMSEATKAENRTSVRVSNSDVTEQNIIDLLELFQQGKTLGSLIRIPAGFGVVLERIEAAIEARRLDGDMNEQIALKLIEPFLRTAKMLAQKYDCVIANPPYMGSKFYNAELKAFANKNYPEGKADLYGCFTLRNIELCKKGGRVAMLTIPNWMFLSTFEDLRSELLSNSFIETLVHNGRGVFGSDFGSCAYTIAKEADSNEKGLFKRLFDVQGSVASNEELRKRFFEKGVFTASSNDFKKIPGSPIAYWVSDKVREVFEEGKYLIDIAEAIQGMITGNNEQFLRLWNEVSFNKLALNYGNISKIDLTKEFWIPYNKGGDLKKWYGNNEFVLNWKNKGKDLVRSRTQNSHLYLKHGVTWTFISASFFAARFFDEGFLWDVSGSSAFANSDSDNFLILSLMCSHVGKYILDLSNPTLNYQVENILALPISSKLNESKSEIINSAKELIEIARADWDSFETSWDFQSLPLLGLRGKGLGVSMQNHLNPKTQSITPNFLVEECWNRWRELSEERITRMQQLETENNRLFIEAYGLQEELSPEVPPEQITLARADAEKDVRRLMSYFIGCLMGRYSLDEAGLVYADAGGYGFDASRYQTFPADDDGIVPVTDMEWFGQEAANRFADFIRVAFGEREKGRKGERENDIDENNQNSPSPRLPVSPSEMSEANLRWIAEKLGGKAGETPLETIRRYFSTSFFKDHLQTYKKRPIYWLFSSGKNKAFECLVYLHRYNDLTLSRMRNDYVTKLFGLLSAQIEEAQKDTVDPNLSPAQKRTSAKKLDTLQKKYAELQRFDEELRHLAEQRISIDLDDGVKVNYGKFGNLLAEKDKICAKEKD